MAMPEIGQGSTCTATGFSMPVLSINADGLFERVLRETTHLATTAARTYKLGTLYDGGTIELGVQWDVDGIVSTGSTPTAPWDGLETAVTLSVIGGAATPCVYTFQGLFMRASFNIDEPDALENGSVTIKVTGPITITP